MRRLPRKAQEYIMTAIELVYWDRIYFRYVNNFYLQITYDINTMYMLTYVHLLDNKTKRFEEYKTAMPYLIYITQRHSRFGSSFEWSCFYSTAKTMAIRSYLVFSKLFPKMCTEHRWSIIFEQNIMTILGVIHAYGSQLVSEENNLFVYIILIAFLKSLCFLFMSLLLAHYVWY